MNIYWLLNIDRLSVPYTPPSPEYIRVEEVAKRVPNLGYQVYFADKRSTTEIETNVCLFPSRWSITYFFYLTSWRRFSDYYFNLRMQDNRLVSRILENWVNFWVLTRKHNLRFWILRRVIRTNISKHHPLIHPCLSGISILPPRIQKGNDWSPLVLSHI